MSEPVNQRKPPPRHRHHFGLGLIAIFKLIKGTLLLAATIGVLELLSHDASASVEHWIMVLRMDPDNKYIHRLLERLANLDPRDLRAVSAGSFFYSALLLIEGVGLWFEKRWAEYLTVMATSSFIPLEIYELAKRLSTIKFLVLGINLVIVWYLVRTLRRKFNSNGGYV